MFDQLIKSMIPEFDFQKFEQIVSNTIQTQHNIMLGLQLVHERLSRIESYLSNAVPSVTYVEHTVTHADEGANVKTEN